MRKHRHLPLVAMFCLLLSGFGSVGAQQQAAVKTVAVADIIFLVDSSWSVGKEHFQLVREFLYDVVKALDVGGNDFRFALVQFSGNPHTEFQLNTYLSTRDVLSHIANMTYVGGGTEPGKGLEYLIEKHLTKAAGSRASEGVPQVIIVLTDGRPRDDVALPSSVLNSARINLFAVSVQDPVEGELQEVASEPLDTHRFNLENFTTLHGIVGDLVASVRSSMTPERAGAKGLVKDITAQESADLIFLIDGSNNIGGVNFPAIRDFLVNLIEILRVGAQQIHIGVVQYSDQPRTEFALNSYSTKADVLDAVKALSFRGGEEANTGAALEFVVENLFTQAGGSRIEEAVPQILVLISGGESSDDIREGLLAVKQAGIFSFSIGVLNADSAELQQIATDGSFAYTALDIRNLDALRELLLPNIVGVAQRLILLAAPTIVTEVIEVNKKDIVFLIDGSTALGAAPFNAIRDFVAKIVQRLEVGPDLIQVAVAQYADTVKPEFYFNTHQTRKDVMANVRKMKLMGGTTLNTGSALDFVRNNFFTSAAGCRIEEGVLPMLVLITGGKSRDAVDQAAAEMKRNRIVTLAIGSRNADLTELQEIAHERDFVFNPNDFRLQFMQAILPEVLSPIRTLSGGVLVQEPSPAGVKRDIVFLVDGSRYAAQEFYLIRDLIGRIVNNLDVGIDTTRISVVQFSEHPHVEFLLNTHSTKDEVQNAVRQLRSKGGQLVNVGEALEFVAKTIFTRPSGSRIEEGVPQFLVILSSRRSDDDFEYPSLQVKQVGVAPMMIAKNVDTDEMIQISLSPEYIFQVSSFQELPSLEQKLLTPIETLTVDQIRRLLGDVQPPIDVSGDEKDIVFLIDSSDSVRPDGLAHIRDFISRIVQQLEVGPNKVRIGVVQFSNGVFPEFYLKTHKSKNAVLEAIRRLRLRGGSPLNAGKALDFVVKNYFIKSAGSRIEDGVPQHLVVILGDRSQDDVNRPARVITSTNIKPLGVGARNVDRDQLQIITNDPGRVLVVQDFTGLSTLEQRVQNILDELPIPTTDSPGPFLPGKKQADIVFLLDGSINLGRDNFQEVLQFVYSVVDAIYRDGDSIQVGLAQYNSDVTDEFFLKDHSTKAQILDAISKVIYKGGRVANTGAAIKHIQERHFVKEAGSRIDQRVPQIAFIVTGGKSTDDAPRASLEITQKGVKVFAVGVRNIDLKEVSQVASESAMSFRVSTAQELSELNEQVLVTLEAAMEERLCPGTTDVTRDCDLDVIIGFDVSDVGPGQSIFSSQRGLESRVESVLNRLTQMQKISCTGNQAPNVRVAIMAQAQGGPVEGLDFSEYRPELLERFLDMRTRGPYYLRADTLRSYLSKFRSSPSGSTKVIIHFTDGVDEPINQLEAASSTLHSEGVNALIFVGLDRVTNFDRLMQLEFGRGFTYNRPLRVNLLDLDFELAEQLDNIAERTCCKVPCKCSGQRGDRGVPGPIGPKGVTGDLGYGGYPGDEGGPGERGPPGMNGTQGFQGCPGHRGTKGSRGFPGEKGELGEMGLDGIDGEEGDKGLPGSSGEKGYSGRRGDKGVKGERGERGDRGLRGDPGDSGADNTQRGSRGQKGEIGPMGDPGPAGLEGQDGGVGRKGMAGRRGPIGVKAHLPVCFLLGSEQNQLSTRLPVFYSIPWLDFYPHVLLEQCNRAKARWLMPINCRRQIAPTIAVLLLCFHRI